MDLFKIDKFVSVIVQNSKTQDTMNLVYRMYDLDIVDRWAALIDKNNQVNNKLRFNYRRILSDSDVEERFQQFKNNIESINRSYDRTLTDIVSIDYLIENQHILNILHEEYEIYGDRLARLIKVGYFNNPSKYSDYYSEPWPGNKNENDKVLHEAFLLLNEQIHNFEALFKNWEDRKKTLCTCLTDFIPAGVHEDLKPEDYFLFTPDHEWGSMYLGYNTLGKHWSSVYRDNDIDVVKRGAVRPQHRFAAEFYMNFSVRQSLTNSRIHLYKWWTDNNISQYCDPRMRLEDFALGFIPVSRLYRYTIDGTTTTINPDMSRQDKWSWNHDVWSRYDSVTSVKIVEKKYEKDN
jgi:hypothetical protein